MRIVAWNLKNIGQTKLTNTFSSLLTLAGLGNNVLDYIVKVVMGDENWAPYTGASPADVFLIIELKSGGKAKGTAATGTAIPTMAAIVKAMNDVANGPRKLSAAYQYASVPAQVIGYHECVGVIYNTKALTLDASSPKVLKDADGFVLPRAPFYVKFTDTAGKPLLVAGIHAPPPGGGTYPFRLPVVFSNKLGGVPEINQKGAGTRAALYVGGDFNCDSTSTYKASVKKVTTTIPGFQALTGTYGYSTGIAAGTLSSMRSRLGTASPPTSTNYLSGAYDNILRATSPTGVSQRILDLIANALDLSVPTTPEDMYPKRVQMLFNNYWKVSDHMPVDLTY
ncbi:MAG TPA: hypothetical protein VHS78_19355 [Candidatus Elarobacter sp.]|nr:hypothetical protein [Candidatus Elarobacter sp.]